MTISHYAFAPRLVVIVLSGRMTMGSMSEEIVALTEELLRHAKGTIIFDLSGVTGLDSAGVGCFILSYNKLAALGNEVRIAGGTGSIFAVFHVTQLDTVLPFFPTLQDAARTPAAGATMGAASD